MKVHLCFAGIVLLGVVAPATAAESEAERLAVSRVAADDQCEHSDDHPEGFGAGRDLVRQGENSRWRARFRGDGDPRQGNPTDILRPRSGEPIAAEENSWNPMDRRDSQ